MRRILVVDDDPIRASRSEFGSNRAAWLRSPTVAPTALRCATMQHSKRGSLRVEPPGLCVKPETAGGSSRIATKERSND